MPLLPYYHRFGQNALRELIEDMCRWVEHNPVPWTDVVLDREQIAAKSADIFDVFREIYIQKAVADGADFWCCKSTFNVYYADELEERLRPFYIYLYRDGRDVAVSFKKAVVGPKHIFHIAREWREEQEIALQFLKEVEESRQISISYEALISDPETIEKRICEKLGIGYDSNMMRYYKSEESQHTAESGKMWANVIKPVLKDNKGKFKHELTSEQIKIFEKVSGEALTALNYSLLYPTENNVILDIATFDRINRELITKMRKKMKTDLQKRAAQENLLVEIKQKLKVP